MARHAPNEQGARDRIIDAAFAIMTEVGINDTTHRRIAERAGVSLGATTYHFATLDDVLIAALDRSTLRYAAYLDAWVVENSHLPYDGLIKAIALSVWSYSTGDNRMQALVEHELQAAALRRIRLASHAKETFKRTHATISALFDEAAAVIMTPLLNGATTMVLLRTPGFGLAELEAILHQAYVGSRGTTQTGNNQG